MTKRNLREDKYHNTDLSRAIEEGNLSLVRSLLDEQSQISDAGLLKQIAIQARNNELIAQFNDLSPKGELSIYYEAKDQLDLMGEDISEILGTNIEG